MEPTRARSNGNTKAMSVGQLANKLVGLDKQKKDAEAALAVVKSQRAEVEQELLEKMAEEGLDQVRAQKHTVYIRREFWPKVLDESPGKQCLIKKLKSHPDTRPFIRESYHTQTLRSWILELPRDDDGLPILPKRLSDLLGVSDKFSVQTRKA